MSDTGDNINITDDTEGHILRPVDEQDVDAVTAQEDGEGEDAQEGKRLS